MAEVLVIDDEASICQAFEQLVRGTVHRCRTVGTVAGAREQVSRKAPDVVFLDVRLPDGDGLELLPEIRAAAPAARVIVMTAFGSIGTAVTAMQGEAFDYLPKPLDLSEVRRVLVRATVEEGQNRFMAVEDLGDDAGPLVGRDPGMQQVFKMIGILSRTDVNVLIEGESGVGKEIVARAIHDLGPRSSSPFWAINCSAIPETLLESELFGFERGTFTGAEQRRQGKFELAGDGTLFLDEVGDMPPALQAKILRALQERRFERVGGSQPIPLRARVIAATHHDLEQDIVGGRFREDLYYRLQVMSFRIPALRERRTDIPRLAGFFIRQANAELGTTVRRVERSVLDHLRSADWPGNVRALENVIKRACVLARGERLLVDHLPPSIRGTAPQGSYDPALEVEHTVEETLRGRLGSRESDEGEVFWHLVGAAEKGALKAALEAAGGNQVLAARLLGLNRGTLRRKMAEFGMLAPEEHTVETRG